MRGHRIDADFDPPARRFGSRRLVVDAARACSRQTSNKSMTMPRSCKTWPRLTQHHHTRRRATSAIAAGWRDCDLRALTRATHPTPSHVNATVLNVLRRPRVAVVPSQRSISYFDCRAGNADSRPSAPRNATNSPLRAISTRARREWP
jgi:hypothetical protein